MQAPERNGDPNGHRHRTQTFGMLAKRHRLLVLELAEIYRPSGLPWDDLTSEGQLGLMRAICRFDRDQGVGFTTHATWWVTVTLQTYVLKHSPGAFGRTRLRDNDPRSSNVAQRRAESLDTISGVAALLKCEFGDFAPPRSYHANA
jgi:DNA-directed RNA polymerase specialized sigma subunit